MRSNCSQYRLGGEDITTTSSSDNRFCLWEGGIGDHYYEGNKAENHGQHCSWIISIGLTSSIEVVYSILHYYIYILPDHSQGFLVEYQDIHWEAQHGHPGAPEYPLPVVCVAVENSADKCTALATSRNVVIIVNDKTVLKTVKLPVSNTIGCFILLKIELKY